MKPLHKKYIKNFVRDLLILGMSIAVTVALVRLGFVESFLAFTASMQILASFISGMFFTSVFTIAPAGIALSALSTRLPLLDVALFGALGAMLVDYVIFFLVREEVKKDVQNMFTSSVRKRLGRLFHLGFMRWAVIVLGAFIIASPLPDELGILLLGFSRIKPHVFVGLAFVMNFIGIVAVGLVTAGLL